MNIPRREVLLALLGAAASSLPLSSAADAYPSKPLRMVVPFPSGQISDVMARVLAEHLKTALGQPVIVENRPGQGGSIGVGAFAKAPADGYGLLVGASAAFSSNTFLFSNIAYHPLKDFQPVTLIATYPVVLTVGAHVPAKDIRELVALMQARPGQLNYASSGHGTVGHMVMEALQVATGGRANHVPFQGSTPAMTALVGGHVDIFVDTVFNAGPQIAAGRIRALAIPAPSRHPALPSVPTLAEAGFASVDREFWGAVFVPAGTPRPVVDRLNMEIRRILRNPSVRDRLSTVNLIDSSPEQAAARIESDYEYWRNVIRRAGIKAE